MISAKLQLSDGTIKASAPNIKATLHVLMPLQGAPMISIPPNGLTPVAAEALRESLMAGGPFDEDLNKVFE